jgi:hypothetical protein
MKATINGLRYNTETSRLIGKVVAMKNTDETNGWTRWEAGLYKTPRSGRYFIAGIGGPMTIFNRSKPGKRLTPGGQIIPLNDIEALDWAEQYLDPETVEEYFKN